MLNDPSEVHAKLEVIFIITLLTVFSSVSDVSTVAVILFDTIVVVVTLAGTLGTWRVYKRSAWKELTLSHLMAKQSM